MAGSPSSVCVANSSFCSGFSFRGTGEAGRGISALSPPASLPPVLLYASPGASPLGDPTSLWEVTGGGDTCAACSRSGGRLVLMSCRFVPPRARPPSSPMAPGGSAGNPLSDASCFLFSHLRSSGVGCPVPRVLGGWPRVSVCSSVLCGSWRLPGPARASATRLVPRCCLGRFQGTFFSFFFFFAHFLIVSNSHPFALFEKPAECIVYNDSLA